MPHETPLRPAYATTHGLAMFSAHLRHHVDGVRQRVQRVTWEVPGKPWARFVVTSTPAPAPTGQVAEPCS